MNQEHFLWPKSNMKISIFDVASFKKVELVETALKKLFPSGYPVLCTSGRAGLLLTLTCSSVTRSDGVMVFPYASHCVLDSINRLSYPLPYNLNNKKSLRIIYHQWGYIQEKNLKGNTIEDCVDSLCSPGSPLFQGGGRFEIWSLPKIIGTSTGGVIWCKNPEDAKNIMQIRDARLGGLLQWVLKLLARQSKYAELYWRGAEPEIGKPSRFQTGEILNKLSSWADMFEDRKVKLDFIWPLALSWLSKPTNRLPTAVPVPINIDQGALINLGIKSGYRMFERIFSDHNRDLIQVIPVPIHQDISMEWLVKVKAALIGQS